MVISLFFFFNSHSRKLWRLEGGDQCTHINGNNGDDDTGQENGCQLVDVLDANKDQQGHEEEADGAVNPHIVQHGCPFAFRVV